MNDEYWKKQPREQLEIEIHNQNLIIQDYMDRLFLITGCDGYGEPDGTDGVCLYCNENNLQRFRRCKLFADMYDKFKKERYAENGTESEQ